MAGEVATGTARRAAALSLGLYLLWVAATYLLEGRLELLQRPDPLGRARYAVVANVVIGTVLAGWLLRHLIGCGLVSRQQVGFRSGRRTAAALLLAAGLGLAIFLAQGPPRREPLVLFNVFAQVLPTSIAEILVCWAVLGVVGEALTRAGGRAVSLAVGAVTAAVLFGVYHFAHSAPFNQPPVVVFLTLIGLLTSLVFFFGRDLYAAVVVHNVLALIGLVNSAPLEAFRQPLYPLYLLALLALAALVGVHLSLARAARPAELPG
jgi:hypothetical protein